MKVTSLALDPIEKKPRVRFRPGSSVLSVGSVGCTMRCPWCQNHEIAQPDDPRRLKCKEVDTGDLVELALSCTDRGNIGLAYTYNEPLLRWRDVYCCAQAIHDAGLVNVVVTNGLLAKGKFEMLSERIDAFNIDLKGFDQSVYDVCGGKLDMVMENIALAATSSHVEVTTLLIPGLNDDLRLIEKEAQWLSTIDPHITLHLTRFFPRFHYSDRIATPRSLMRSAAAAAREHLDDVVLGNI